MQRLVSSNTSIGHLRELLLNHASSDTYIVWSSSTKGCELWFGTRFPMLPRCSQPDFQLESGLYQTLNPTPLISRVQEISMTCTRSIASAHVQLGVRLRAARLLFLKYHRLASSNTFPPHMWADLGLGFVSNSKKRGMYNGRGSPL